MKATKLILSATLLTISASALATISPISSSEAAKIIQKQAARPDLTASLAPRDWYGAYGIAALSWNGVPNGSHQYAVAEKADFLSPTTFELSYATGVNNYYPVAFIKAARHYRDKVASLSGAAEVPDPEEVLGHPTVNFLVQNPYQEYVQLNSRNLGNLDQDAARKALLAELDEGIDAANKGEHVSQMVLIGTSERPESIVSFEVFKYAPLLDNPVDLEGLYQSMLKKQS